MVESEFIPSELAAKYAQNFQELLAELEENPELMGGTPDEELLVYYGRVVLDATLAYIRTSYLIERQNDAV